MMQANIINFGVKRAVRELCDLEIQNFVWYFNNYPNTLSKETRDALMEECRKEAERRGLEVEFQ